MDHCLAIASFNLLDKKKRKKRVVQLDYFKTNVRKK